MEHIQEQVNKIEKQIVHEQKKEQVRELLQEGKKIGIEKLPYSYSAVKRFIDSETMNVHYNKHYKGYVDKLNGMLKKRKGDHDLEKIITNISRYPKGVRDNAGGAFNHALFWNMLSPTQQRPSKDLVLQIKKDFGSYEKFKKNFEDIAMQRFGSGWVWLVLTNKGTLKIMSTPNQDNPLMNIIEGGGYPILGLDLWEHAYYLKYKNKRDEYIKNFWTVVNWDFVQKMYELKTETKLLESKQMGLLLKESKVEHCSRADIEFFRNLFNVNVQARNTYKNTINDTLKKVFSDKYHDKKENGEIPGIYYLEKPGRSVINFLNTNYSAFCIIMKDVNQKLADIEGEELISFTDKTPGEQQIEMKRFANWIEKLGKGIFDTNGETFQGVIKVLTEKDKVGSRREKSALKTLKESLPDVKVIGVSGAGKSIDAEKKIDAHIVIEGKKKTAQIKGFAEILEQNGKLIVTKTGEVAKYNVDLMVFVKGNKVAVFENNGEIVMGNYVFNKKSLLYDLR
jgi:superoxide dismutase, Fe-Mn family